MNVILLLTLLSAEPESFAWKFDEPAFEWKFDGAADVAVEPSATVPAASVTRPVVEMLVPGDFECKYCDWWKARGDADLPFEISVVITDKEPKFGYPTFRVPEANGREWFIGNSTCTEAGVKQVVNKWREITGNDQVASSNPELPTPVDAVVKGVALTGVKPGETLVDYGSGDGRVLVEAAMFYNAKAIGVENDAARVAESRRTIDALDIESRVIVRLEDATKSDVKGDVAYVYQNPALLSQLAPKLREYRRVVSYMHEVPGMRGTKNGDFWVYERQSAAQSEPQIVMQERPYAIYYGTKYYQANGNCGCSMCNEIRRQIANREHVEQYAVQVQPQAGYTRNSGCSRCSRCSR